jgi:hypothetical protein
MAKLSVLMAAAWLGAATLAAAPQAPAAHQRASNAPVAKATAKPKVTDSQLEAAIRAKFAKSKINEDKFTVRVQGGIATIDGKTNGAAQGPPPNEQDRGARPSTIGRGGDGAKEGGKQSG